MSKVVMNRRMPAIMILAIALAAGFVTACSKGASSPTAAIKGYYEAAKNKDYAAAKKYLSANTITLMEMGSKKMGKSPEEAFKESSTDANTSVMPEFSNEKITGDTATVDMKAQGQTVTMPLVKENGEWKLAMDKLFGDMSNSMNETSKPSTGAETKPPVAAEDDDNENHNSGH
jgi:DUF2950 family protein